MADNETVEVYPKDTETAQALHEAAESLNLDVSDEGVIGTNSYAFVVLKKVADKAKLPEHAAVVEIPADDEPEPEPEADEDPKPRRGRATHTADEASKE